MIRRALTTMIVLAALAAPLRADLEYTMHLTMTNVAPSASTHPMTADIAASTKSPLPDGPADVVYVIGDRGVRAEFRQAAHNFAAGTVTITKSNGDAAL